MKQPHNESETHFLLKEIAKYVLWGWGYNKLATEVHNMYDFDICQRFSKSEQMKSVMDVVGVKKIGKFIPGRGYECYYDVRGIEAKASISDFKNGFCCAPSLTYIIAPIGIIPVDLLPEKIGLIEVDFADFSMKKLSNKISGMNGINLTAKAKRRIDRRFKDQEAYRRWCQDMLETVAYRCSQELLFWRNAIEFEGEGK